ncbi:hypothetical protein DAPPUDRAFT_101467 [Daphnia pulex]|uniref:Uncharacterized protein n=1 Tax=Daphnia pulex TaxID=6669 RepID=E9GDG3_DAPPU|nr:hypothetical protein DAPPUDRAFT_101467 [Daphnia pulex]|eukprot:EFX82078.1 hypothetical protein DAPPUDRAFT_101467 [Daphnia pulex]
MMTSTSSTLRLGLYEVKKLSSDSPSTNNHIGIRERQQGAVTSARSLEVIFNSTAAAEWSLDYKVFLSYSSFKIKNSARLMGFSAGNRPADGHSRDPKMLSSSRSWTGEDRRCHYKIRPWPTGRRLERIAAVPAVPAAAAATTTTTGAASRSPHARTFANGYQMDPGPRRIAAATSRSSLQDRTLAHGSKTGGSPPPPPPEPLQDRRTLGPSPMDIRWDPGPRRIAAATTRSSPLQQRTSKIFKCILVSTSYKLIIIRMFSSFVISSAVAWFVHQWSDSGWFLTTTIGKSE